MKAFIFSEKRTVVIARHLVFWLVWILLYVTVYTPKINVPGGFSYVLSFYESAGFVPVHVALSYFVVYVIITKYIVHSRYIIAAVLIVLSVVIAGLASHAVSVWFIDPSRVRLGLPLLNNSLTISLMSGLRSGISVAGFAGTIKLLKYLYVEKIENEELRHAKVSAELSLLKAQLHPHLLFNTLNNLYSHILKNSAQSGDIVLKLSELLRYMLYDCGQERVPLISEIRMMENYVELERIRYDEKVDISLKIAGVQTDKFIAPLILLPFVENAFKHGTSQIIGESWISISVEIEEQNFCFKVINSVPEIRTKTNSQGIGLSNVRKRLELLYSGKHSLKVTSEEDLFIVTLKIALDFFENDNPPIKTPSQYEPS